MNEFGPNVRKLLIVKMSRDAIPDGGGLADGIEFFANLGKRKRIMAGAEEWVRQAIAVVRQAAEPNPWKVASDEEIAAELLRRIEERQPPAAVSKG
jgi:hypothetical protein